MPSIAKRPWKLPCNPAIALLMYTDGLTENFNAQNDMLGIEGLSDIVRDTSALPLPQMKQEILDRIAQFRHGPPADDMSLVLVEIS